MDNKTIATKMKEGIDQRVNECHGWCEITDLNGDFGEGLYLATFADDSRIVFEDDQQGFLHVMLTKDQTQCWDALYEEERIQTLEEILLFYRRFMQDNGLEVNEASNRKKFEVTIRLTVDLQKNNKPNEWYWHILLGLPEADVALTSCKEVGDEV